MNKIQIQLKGRIPSKKNSKQFFIAGGRPILAPSKNYKLWHEEQMWVLSKNKPKKPIENFTVQIVFRAPDKRKTDLSNKAESIMDLLVDAGYITDDNWFCCPKLNLSLEGINKENPGADVIIRYD